MILDCQELHLRPFDPHQPPRLQPSTADALVATQTPLRPILPRLSFPSVYSRRSRNRQTKLTPTAMNFEKDVEKFPEDAGAVAEVMTDDGAVPGESFEVGDSLYAKLQRFAGKYGVEQRGIERVPENERTDTHGLLNVGTMV